MSKAVQALSPFADRAAKARADTFGMFVFLASEVMLFGAIIVALAAYRALHPGAAGEAARRLALGLATTNTAVLLTSSLAVAIAAVAARRGRARTCAAGLGAATALGATFLGVKAIEYRLDYLDRLAPRGGVLGEGPAALFLSLYYVATALHGLHVAVGIGLLSWAAIGVGRRRLALPARAATVELVGLYWHLVDVIWVFLFPLLYLARP